MIIDSSIILAIYFRETHAIWAAEQLNQHQGIMKMSTVNLSEILIQLQDKQPENYSVLSNQLLQSGIRFIPPDIEQAKIAAAARLRFPINLGDCFVYALAQVNQCPILTLDSDFKKTDNVVISPK